MVNDIVGWRVWIAAHRRRGVPTHSLCAQHGIERGFYSCAECLKTGRIVDSENETHTANQVLRVLRLQAPSCEAFSRVDVFRPVSVLANPLFLSSHQDKLWEESSPAERRWRRLNPL